MAQSDIFLRFEGKSTGLVKGESNVPEHPDEIEITAWGWGMTGSQALGGGGPSARTALSEIKFHKRTDRATTQLMAVMRTNEEVKKAVLCVRKAGTSPPLDYLKVQVLKGRITSYKIGNGSPGDPEMVDEFSLAFEEIEITYAPQSGVGNKEADLTFTAQVHTD